MSCLSQHKTKEELSDWLMNNASDNETTGFLDMLAGDIWDMMENTEENKKLKEKDKEWKASDKHLNKCIDTIRDQYLEQKGENQSLRVEIAKLKDKGEKLRVECLDWQKKGCLQAIKHDTELEEKDANWNDWLNKAFGDDLYPISPSPEPDDFVEKVQSLRVEIAKLKKLKKEHIQNMMKTTSIATELYREVKYALGYGEFDEPDRKVMYEEIKKLKEMSRDKVRELVGEYFHGERVSRDPEVSTSYTIYDWDSEEESESEEEEE